MTARRYAVFGLLDDETAQAVRSTHLCLSAMTRNVHALRFPVHITLRGRFRADPEAVSLAWEHLPPRHESQNRFRLVGPVFRSPDLLWLEVGSEGSGHPDMVRWHGELARVLEDVVTEDETLPAHAREGYRPHVTLGWRGDR